MNVQAQLDSKSRMFKLDTSLQIMFKLELIIKYKSLSSAWLGLAWFISQAKLELNIKPKLKLNIMLLSLRSNTSILSSPYQVYYLAYLVWMSGLNL